MKTNQFFSSATKALNILKEVYKINIKLFLEYASSIRTYTTILDLYIVNLTLSDFIKLCF